MSWNTEPRTLTQRERRARRLAKRPVSVTSVATERCGTVVPAPRRESRALPAGVVLLPDYEGPTFMTCEEIGAVLGITTQAVQQIEIRALAKMRRGFMRLGITGLEGL